jgi:TPR repeat protein
MDPPDHEAARRWWVRAAEAGNSRAKHNLGRLHHKVMKPPDLDAARAWYERAIGSGNRRAKHNLQRLDLTAAWLRWQHALGGGRPRGN